MKRFLLFTLLLPFCSFATRYYVKPTATGSGDGLSWANATTLQNAVYLASTASDEIWVVQGTYYPTTGSGRLRTLLINNGTIKLYGGFQGGELLINQRNPSIYPTIISGDFNNDDPTTNFSPSETTRQDNAYHIITVKTTPANPTINLTLDGFVLKGGNANGPTQTTGAASTQYYHTRGGAIYAQTLVSGDVINVYVINSILEKNSGTDTSVSSAYFSSGVIIQTVRTDFNRCIIRNNYSDTNSALLIAGANGYSIFGNSEISNCLFHNNSSTSGASCILLSASNASGGNQLGINVDIINSTFASNTSTNGIVFKTVDGSNVRIKNTIIYSNGSNAPFNINGTLGGPALSNTISQGGQIGGINVDPLLNSDFTLSASSSAIDTGNNSWTTGMVYDLMGEQRIINTTVDKGCYEYNPALKADDFNFSDFSVYPNPTNGILNISSIVSIENIEIYSLEGRKVKSIDASTIDISDLTSGMYLLQVKTEDGKIGAKKVFKI